MAPEPDDPPQGTEAGWLDELGEIDDPAAVDAYLAARPELHHRESIEDGTQEIVRLARQDLARAERLSTAINRLAEIVDDGYGRALALKARGHLKLMVGSTEEALTLYRACQESFEKAGAEVEAAVNRGTVSLWMLALLGRYDEAWADSVRARETLERHGDLRLLARVTSTEGNIFLRQDRHDEALVCFRSALAMFREGGEPQEVAVALHNIAVSSIAVNDFQGALASYHELSGYCSEHHLGLLAAQADYNIAYLYFFRGEYARAIRIYQETRDKCEELGDLYHLALCDLDQAEIYLELNLSAEAARLARLALVAFEDLGNGYEAGKALAFLGVAASRKGETPEALEHFSQAGERFAAEGNRAWGAMVRFYRALILVGQHRLGKARESCAAAREFFAGVPWPSRVALCDLLLAQIDLQENRTETARTRCREALERLEALDLPALEFKALVALARAEEALGDKSAALEAYRRAHGLLENLRTHLGSEESKLAFFSDKHEVYESLVEMTLHDRGSTPDLERVFGYMEQAKSRILADLVASGGSALRTSSTDHPELLERIRLLREELSQHHHELQQLYNLQVAPAGENPAPSGGDLGVAPPAALAPGKIEAVNRRSRECEQGLLDTMRELSARHSDFASLHSAEIVSFERIRASIPDDAVLLEYFESRGIIYGCVLSSNHFDIRPVAEAEKLASPLRLLRNQMSKYQLGEDYLKRFGESTERTVQACLEEIHASLIAPIEGHLEGEHLIVVPHGALHQIPFHALSNGEDYLLDRFSFSYAPSASLYSALQERPLRSNGKALVLGIPDERAPEIRGEVEIVANTLPGARVFLGEDATGERLRTLGPESRIVHIATHGFFRQDNPMFSAIQLGDSRLTLLDLYDLELGAELVVLSGCSTGLHKIETGDELMGLTRGLLYAGARALMVSLWDVHDKSTSGFMQAFYGHLGAETNRACALGKAMKDLRAEYPSPYYWAPFVLVGRYADPRPAA